MTDKNDVLIIEGYNYRLKNKILEIIQKEKIIEYPTIFKINRGKGKSKNKKDRWN